MYFSIVWCLFKWSSVIFNIALTLGLNSSILSSWKLLSSVTNTDSSLEVSIVSITGFPILPTTYVSRFALEKISPTKLVVVVFPFVPVIPIKIGLFDSLKANSTSPIIYLPEFFNFNMNGRSSGTPGDTTTISISSTSSGWCPNMYFMSFIDFNSSSIFLNLFSSFISFTIILAPNLSKCLIVDIPVFASPTNKTFFPFKSIFHSP